MKTITKEEALYALKNDEELQKKLRDSIKKRGGQINTDLEKIINEAGYELKKDNDINEEELSDDELKQVAGGESFIDRSEICKFIMELFGYDTETC